MGIGVSVLLLAVGAILAFAVRTATIMGVDVHVVGYILMAAGVVGLIWSLIVLSMSRRRLVAPTVDAVAPPTVDEAPVVVQRPAVQDDREYRPGGF